MASNSVIPAATTDYLAKLADHVDGQTVLYATRFSRSDAGKMKAMSRTISSRIPSDGWIIATASGIEVFKKSLTGGVGSSVGTLTSNAVANVSVAHGKKATKTQITIAMVDQSVATLSVRTGESYPALSPWVRGQAAPAAAEAAKDDAPLFDTEELLRSMPGH